MRSKCKICLSRLQVLISVGPGELCETFVQLRSAPVHRCVFLFVDGYVVFFDIREEYVGYQCFCRRTNLVLDLVPGDLHSRRTDWVVLFQEDIHFYCHVVCFEFVASLNLLR